MKPWSDLKWLALAIVGTVLVVLAVGAAVNQIRGNEGFDPGVASAGFALMGAMVAGAFGAAELSKKDEEDRDE